MKRFEKIIAVGMLLFAIGFNLWLYRLEPSATIDPNDNAFQFALVDRTNQIWDFAQQKCTSKFGAWNLGLGAICHVSYLADHWVPNWAEGYNLPFYYSHVPQILIVGSYRLINSFIHVFNYSFISLFTYYHWVIYMLLSLFPLTVFFALRMIKLPWLIAGMGALLASHLSTDGLYGLDPSSFLWRGYGLSSQLFGMIWLPLVIASSYRFFSNQELGIRNHADNRVKGFFFTMIHDSNFLIPIFFLTATAMGHLGLGIMAMLSLVPLALARPILMVLHQESLLTIYEVTKNQLTKLLFLSAAVIFFLSYWIVPIFLADNYHNISFWDPPWKFASYGARETIMRLFNGDLFDWGRGPWMTAIVIVGLIGAAWPRKQHNNTTIQQDDHSAYFPFSLLFLFWLLMYFGRGTWGGLIDLIPGMKEFHLSRFIVGVHVAGLFLIPIGIQAFIGLGVHFFTSLESRITNYELGKMIKKISHLPVFLSYCLIVFIVLPPIYRQTVSYSTHNDRLIKQSIESHAKVKTDEAALFAAIRALPPGRVYAGRGGGFGKDFRVSETPYYMDLSTYGIPSVLWLPETWSPNSDVEQYFNEDKARDYDLFGIRYVAAPPSLEPKKFWKLITESKTWKLYEIDLTGDANGRDPDGAQPFSVESSSIVKKERNASTGGKEERGRTRRESVGYFTTGVRPAVVATDKRSYGNVVRLWIQPASPELQRGESDAHARGLYPELTFAKNYPRTTGLPNFKMLDEVTYIIPDGSKHNLFKEPPVYMPPGIQSLEQFNKLTIQQPASPAGGYNTATIEKEDSEGDMIFRATVSVGDNCTECIVVLKQSFHPNWRTTIDGKPAQTFTVFPFYLATLVPTGTHEIVFSYEPGRLKVLLLMIEIVVVVGLLIYHLYDRHV